MSYLRAWLADAAAADDAEQIDGVAAAATATTTVGLMKRLGRNCELGLPTTCWTCRRSNATHHLS